MNVELKDTFLTKQFRYDVQEERSVSWGSNNKNKTSEFTNGIICRVCYGNSQVIKIEWQFHKVLDSCQLQTSK